MKTKLTLTVQKSVIQTAKVHSPKKGKFISGFIEEIFKKKDIDRIQSEPQRAALRLLKWLKTPGKTTSQKDKILLKKHIKEKYVLCISEY